MADFDYLESAQDALELLIDFGGTEPGLTFTHLEGGGGIPGGEDLPTETTWSGVGLQFAYTDRGATTRSGSLIVAGDQQGIVAAIDADGVAIRAPMAQDTCAAPDGVTYTIINVDTLAPNGQAALYELQLRR